MLSKWTGKKYQQLLQCGMYCEISTSNYAVYELIIRCINLNLIGLNLLLLEIVILTNMFTITCSVLSLQNLVWATSFGFFLTSRVVAAFYFHSSFLVVADSFFFFSLYYCWPLFCPLPSSPVVDIFFVSSSSFLLSNRFNFTPVGFKYPLNSISTQVRFKFHYRWQNIR